MNRYIGTELLKADIRPFAEYESNRNNKDWVKRVEIVIDDQPTADVVEVVRCKDCKYAEVADPEDSQDGYICQFHRGCIWFSGSYCSFGERAEE